MSAFPGLDTAVKIATEISKAKFRNMGVEYSPDGEYTSSMTIYAPRGATVQVAKPPAPPPAPKKGVIASVLGMLFKRSTP